jgi:chaperone modulatory protein CbpM
VSYALVRAGRMGLDDFAAAAGAHPDLIRKLVALGIIDAYRGQTGELWFSPGQLAVLGRVQRLRAGFALNYAAVGLVVDLLDRIAVLEAALGRTRRRGG